VAKTTVFASEAANGVAYASYAGGTHIFIRGVGFVMDNPEAHTIMFESHEFGTKIQAPAMTQDDGFNSHPMTGVLAYRTPSLWDLFGMDKEMFDHYNTLNFWITVYAKHELLMGGTDPIEIECAVKNNCKIVYRRHYSPAIFWISPRVVYNTAKTEIWFDPRSTPGVIQDLTQEDMPFINARIGGALIDFEDSVTFETSFSHWNKNRVRGEVGELPIAENHTLAMMWETGLSDIVEHTAKYCNFDNSTCYYAKTVPVVFGVTENSGYHTGGQNLTITGHGFQQGNIRVTIDGVECPVSRYQEDSISCEIQAKGEVSVVGEPIIAGPGLRNRYVNKNNIDVSNMDQYNSATETVLT